MLMNLWWNRYTRSLTLTLLQWLPIRKGRVVCVSWSGGRYNCNPRAIVEQMSAMGLLRADAEDMGPAIAPSPANARDAKAVLSPSPAHAKGSASSSSPSPANAGDTASRGFEVFYAFHDPARFASLLPRGVRAVGIGSQEYFKALATAQFVVSNTRFAGGLYWPKPKRRGQYYIQTMHGGHGMKKQELEVSESLPPAYLTALYRDAGSIDLMLSDSAFWSEKARTIFAYPQGEILEEGLPRNDAFFLPEAEKQRLKAGLIEALGIPNAGAASSALGVGAMPADAPAGGSASAVRFLIYCPTFRSNGRRDVYGMDADRVVAALEQRFGGVWYILISSHPNMQGYYREIYDFAHPRVKDIGGEDLQPYLVAGDAAITDYSSAGFEFALSGKPCFLLCRDLEDYDRGVYFDMRRLPFPYAESDDELIARILHFDDARYRADLDRFNREVIGLRETGHAAEAVVRWMQRKMGE